MIVDGGTRGGAAGPVGPFDIRRPLRKIAGRMPHRAKPDAPADPRFRRMLINVVLVPLGLMLGVAVLLVVQIGHLLRDSGLVAHSDLVLAQAYDAQKVTLDLETGLRGFLVTGDDRFLAPYNNGLANIDAQVVELRYRTRGRPDQQARTDVLRGRLDPWLAYARRMIALRRAGGAGAGEAGVGGPGVGGPAYAAVAVNAEGKRLMDAIRAAFADLIGVEVKLRDTRADDARSASRATFVLVGVVAVVGGSLLAIAARHQVLELARTYDRAIADAHDANVHLEKRVAERTAELNHVNGQLGEMNKELEAFAYSVSHDLRAPMRHITGFANLLKMSVGPGLTKDDAENLATIHDTARLAGRMVDDLLGFSRVGRVPVAVSRVDVGALVEQCRQELAPDTAGRQLAWTVRPIPPVAADPALLKMVVRNLMSNAVKYTAKRPAAAVDIGPTGWPAGAAGPPPGGVTFAVTDNGIGFDMAYAHKLFGVFQRLHRAEDFDGTGIGLANVKRIILRLGGGVWAQGVPDRGATFYVSLPAADAAAGPVVGGLAGIDVRQ